MLLHSGNFLGDGNFPCSCQSTGVNNLGLWFSALHTDRHLTISFVGDHFCGQGIWNLCHRCPCCGKYTECACYSRSPGVFHTISCLFFPEPFCQLIRLVIQYTEMILLYRKAVFQRLLMRHHASLSHPRHDQQDKPVSNPDPAGIFHCIL